MMDRKGNAARRVWKDWDNRKGGGRKGYDQGRIPAKLSNHLRLLEANEQCSVLGEQQGFSSIAAGVVEAGMGS